MQFKDYYKIMGVAPEASADEIKNAYRKLARKFHPDVSKEPQADKRFKEVGEAYEALKDPEKRAAYDKLRAGGWREGQEMEAPPQAQEFRGGAGGAGGGFSSGGGFAGAEGADFSDFFQSLFGGPPPGAGRRGGFGRHAFHERGEDIHHAMAVTLEESYHGGERQLQLQVPQVDEHGAVSAGVRTIAAKIPKGVIQGTKIRLRGQGHPGATADGNGDLYLEVELAPHRLYRVDGRDLSLEVPIAPWEAVLGTQAPVPTLGGTVTATIPAGAQDGQKLRLKGRGLPGEPPGDQYLVLRIVVPPQVSDKAKALYRDLAKESAFNPRAKLGV